MRLRLTPQDSTFFDLLAQSAALLVEAAALLPELLQADPAGRERVAERMRDAEHRADDVTHEILRKLNSTFVTPFDREDIYALASSLDDCMDDMDEAVDLIVLYKLNGLPSGVAEQAAILSSQAQLTAEAMPQLRTMTGLEEYWVEINRLENNGDRTFRGMLAQLFEGTPDPVALLKVKDVITVLESAIDAFERVANHVQTIAVKES